jgi:predicted regulator of Ras-like GTPase activity (Roadblock/LC7/MglB family)
MDSISQIIEKASIESAQQSSDISKVLQKKLTYILNELMSNCGDITSAMISSNDGIAWASHLQNNLDQHRFAAMSSALLALSDNLIRETNNGTTRNTLLESSEGNVFVMHAGNTMLLTVFTKSGANLGMSLAYSKKAAEEIEVLSNTLI